MVVAVRAPARVLRGEECPELALQVGDAAALLSERLARFAIRE